MAEYYYTVATLPMLQKDTEPPITLDYFLETCRYTVSESDYTVIEGAGILPGQNISGNDAIGKWNMWETTLRNELARLRAGNTGIEAGRYLVDSETAAGPADIARSAVNASNPRVGEDILDAARWNFLDEMESGHNFDLTSLIVYHLKLQIAVRKKMMNRQQGEEKYRELYDSIADKIHQSYDGEL